MKKALIIMLVFSLFILNNGTTCLAEENDSQSVQYDFKKFCWGDTKEKVISVEGTPKSEEQMKGINASFIAYKTNAVGLDVLLAYSFCEEGLYAVVYASMEEHSNDSLYIDDYNSFKSALEKKYGEPAIDKEIWQDDRKEEYYKKRKGDALSYGYLSYYTVFFTDTTRIEMKMSSDNYKITTTIAYASKEISTGAVNYSNEI